MFNKKELEKIDELLAFIQQAKLPGSSQAVFSQGSSQADEDITIKMAKSDTAVTSSISEKVEESAVTSTINKKMMKVRQKFQKNHQQ
ncbi:20977_t:CDS:2 [Rhizophagus irregularis]|nr:20977_t:CDS:2 [Rhizophagus irregularis]